MPTTTKTRTELNEGTAGLESASGERSSPGGRAQRAAGAAPPPRGSLEGLPLEVREQLSDELIDELLAGARTEEEIVGPGGLLADLTRRLVERAMSAELTEHLGYEPHQEPPGGTGNTRNGSSPKTLATEHGPVRIKAPRDRDSSFEPQIVRKGQRRFQGFDDKILALYSRGLSTRDIEAHLKEIYGVAVGRDLISRVTDEVIDDVRAWQQRPLDDVYPVIFLDALVLKIREGGTVQRRACYLALGVTVEGERDVLGMWFQETEGAKFWMQVLTDLKTRGVRDILICCVDGLKGFPEAIEAIFPETTVQTCVVHLIRHSLKYVPRREREQVARDLKPIYTAADADAAQAELERFDEKWGKRFPVITQAWLNAWDYVIPFLAFPEEVRRVIYTTDESVKSRGLISWSRGACGGGRVAVRGGRSPAGRPAKRGPDGFRRRVGAWEVLVPQDVVDRGWCVGVRLCSGRGRPRAKRRFWD
ncbi:MAG: IS256 family transposase [Solirubrobacterales bacterium]|nr:IS256 family transposase [Solirubrobacterales bacterium]